MLVRFNPETQGIERWDGATWIALPTVEAQATPGDYVAHYLDTSDPPSPPRTLADLAREAYQVQDASNLSGVLLGAYRALCALRRLDDTGGHRPDTHPIMALWADKIAHLSGTQSLGDERVIQAYADVHQILTDADIRALVG